MNGWLRHTIWFSRALLLIAAVLFLAIASRNIVDPAAAEGPVGIAFSAPGGVTVARVGFGAFPLGFAIILMACLVSERRLLLGLRLLSTLVVVLTAVRILGLIVDGPAAFTLKVLRPEIALTLLSTVGVYLESKRRARATPAEAPGGFVRGLTGQPSGRP
jgi:hypothetical protein